MTLCACGKEEAVQEMRDATGKVVGLSGLTCLLEMSVPYDIA